LPFNLGVRPEAYVAFGTTAVAALLWRARTLCSVGLAGLVAGVCATASPAAVLLAAPVLVFAPKIWWIVTANTTRGVEVAARVSVLCCLGAVALVLVFADQSWHAVAVATVWHTRFGPSLPWFDEFARYRYLLGADQDGTATKRLPVLLSLALLPVVALLLARTHPPAPAISINTAHPRTGAADEPAAASATPSSALISSGAARLAAMVSLGLGSLWLAPSKWTHYFGALAGMFAAFLVVTIVFLAQCARRPETAQPSHPQPSHPQPSHLQPSPPQQWTPGWGRGGGDPVLPWVGLCGTGVVAVAIGLAFSGPNAWWQPGVYDVAWASQPITPAGVPLNSPLLWAAMVAVGVVVIGRRRGIAVARRAVLAGPALLALTAVGVSVAVLLGSFVAAPLRQPSGSLALSNIHRLTGHPTCGLGDDVQVLPDVAGSVMTPATNDPGQVRGFIVGAGYDPGAPPPDPPGTGSSTQLWGSLGGGPTGALNTATLTSAWFRLPTVAPDQEVAVSVAGRTTAGNMLALEFGRADPDGVVTPLGRRTPPDPLRAEPGQPPHYRLWRAVGIAAAQVPTGADRVRVDAVDASSDPDGWLAVTGPRLRDILPLSRYLTEHSPVLVAWPIAYLFPCATNPVAVRGGRAQAPVAVLEAAQRYSGLGAATTDPTIGGDYAPLRQLGGLGEVTTRIVGRPDLDWGDLLLTNYPAARDTYATTTTWTKVSGLHGAHTPPPPPSRASIP
jgi:arabinosyltransferase C